MLVSSKTAIMDVTEATSVREKKQIIVIKSTVSVGYTELVKKKQELIM